MISLEPPKIETLAGRKRDIFPKFYEVVVNFAKVVSVMVWGIRIIGPRIAEANPSELTMEQILLFPLDPRCYVHTVPSAGTLDKDEWQS